MHIKPIEKKTVVDEIVEQIKALIINGLLQPGDKLDSERILAEKFQVGRPAIREGLKALTSMGLVKKTPEGNLINPEVVETIGEPLLLEFLLKPTDIRDLFEARKILETEIIKLAVKRYRKHHLDQMKEYLTIMQEGNDALEFTEADISFHLCIAKASENQVLLTFLSTVRGLLKQSTIKLLQDQGMVDYAIYYHKCIYNAIEDQDMDLAVKSMYEHLLNAEENLLRIIKKEDKE